MEEQGKYVHGGVRVPGPGKKLGAPVKVKDAREITLYLSVLAVDKLRELAGEDSSLSEVARNIIEAYVV